MHENEKIMCDAHELGTIVNHDCFNSCL